MELPGDDSLDSAGEVDPVIDEIQEFLTGTRPTPQPDRVLGTVMFVNIVGSTERLAAIGDREWRTLLDRYYEAVSRELDRFRGEEVDRAGDGVLAFFDGPARAIHCADAIVHAVRKLGLDLRVGLHTGEVERVRGGIKGIAVHIGARVAGAAEAGAVVVSSTVKDLVAGSGIGFDDLGPRSLKGVPGQWNLFRVRPADGSSMRRLPRVKTVDLSSGVTLPYVEQGDPAGIPAVLLHGFADSWRSFERVLPHLPDAFHVFALTQRGHGDASRPAEGYSINEFATDLLGFTEALHLSPAVIVGHSMGSAVALRFAIDHPEGTLGLVLLGASAGGSGTEAAREFWDSTVSTLTDPVDPALIRGMTESTLVKPVPPDFLEMAVAEGQKVPAHVWKAAFQSRWRLEGDLSGELDQIKVRTLIVWRDQDRRYPRSEQEMLATAIADSHLVIYRGAGHLLHWEKPDRFAFDLTGFVVGRFS